MEASSEHMSGRTARKMDSTVLDCFTALADDNEKKRIDAGLKLLEHVFIKQSDYEEEGLCTELNYALKRLVRGVASSRPNARKGFFTALVGLFSTFTSIPLHEITSAIKKELHSTNASKSEEAETYTGHILVYGALIRSNLFLNTTAEEHAEIFNRLLECGSKRSFLLLPAHSFLVNLIEKTGKESFENAIWPILKDKVKPLPEENLEMLHFLLLARTLYPVVVKKKFLVTHVGAPEIIHEDTLQICATLLLNVRSGSDYSHPVHEEFAKQLAKSSLLSSFWEKGIETELEKPKDFKKYLAVELFYYVLKYLEDKSQIPDMLTPRFVNLIIKSLERFSKKVIPKHDRVCIRAHEVFVNYMLKTSLKDSPVKDKTIVKMVKKLSFGCGGELMFDRVTGTRVVQNLIYMLKENGVKKVADMFRDVISGTSGKKKGLNEEPRPWTNKERMYACDLYARILGLPAVMQESEWKSEQAQFLLYKGFFLSKDQEQGSTGIGALLADSLRQSFYRVLNQRMSKMEDVRKLLYSLVHQANKLITEGEERLRVPLSEEAMESWEKVVSTSENLNQELEAGKDVTLARVFHTMFLYMGLMLLTDAKLAQDALGELYGCYERVEKEHKEKKKKKKMRKSVGEEEVNEPEWVEVAVELVLSLLSQNSSIPKNVVDMFFANLCPYLTSAALGQITQVLDPAVDDNPLLNSWNDEKEENYKKGDTSEDSKSESDEESESDMSDVEDENEAVDDKLRMAVRDALGSAAPLTDTESVDIDEMDEEEGRRLNQALSEAFRMYKSSKSNKKSKKQFKDDRILMHFRIRAIDLLEIYLKSEHLGTQASLASYIDIMLVLFNLLEFCIQDIHQKPLENRVRTCLKKLSSKANVSMQGVTEEMIAEALKRLMEKGEKTSGPIYMDMVPKIVECCTFLVRCSEKLPVKNGKTTSLIEEIYKNALTSFFTKRDCLHQPGLFKSVLEIVWTGNLALLPLLVQFAFDPDVRPFRRNQALFLLTIFFRNRRFRTMPELIKIAAPKIKEIEATLSDNSIKLLQSHISEDGDHSVGRGVTQKFIHQLFTVMLTIWNSHSSDNREEMGIDWSSFGQCLVAYRDKFDLSREAKISFNQLARALNIKWVPSQKGAKLTEKGDQSEPEKSSEEEGEEDVEVENDSESTKQGQKKKNKDKKRKTKNNVAKLKKQTRELRLASLSEGLENVSFAVMKRNADVDEGHENSDFETAVHSNLVNGKSKKKDKFDKRKSDESNEDEKRTVKKKKN